MLYDKHGQPQSSFDSIKNIVTDFYKVLFARSRDPIHIDQLGMVKKRVDGTMTEELLCPYQREEVLLALKEMHPSKSPGPDGLPAMFYQKFWDLVGDETCNMVLNYLNGGSMPDDLNHTYVVLIPKVRKPVDMKDLRPISLCNVSYKLISKVLENRLKRILPAIIEENQSAFVPGRLITDNILLSSEVFHFMRHSQAQKHRYMALKLDMSKAYDRIEWDYLSSIMIQMGFPTQWVDRVMLCVSSVSYSFLVNGQPTDRIIPQRGLRQGDPLSPYLFLLCAEGFGCLIRKAHEERVLHGISISRACPNLSHLFFADDSLIFARANLGNATAIKKILQTYEFLSGQQINLDKSEISFSRGLGHEVRNDIQAYLGMEEVRSHDKYLGLPTIFDRSKKISFSGIRDRIWKKLQGWKKDYYPELERRFSSSPSFILYRATR